MAGDALDEHPVGPLGEGQRAERNPLIQAASPADDARFPNDHAGAVIDEERLPDGRAGMDIDAGDGVGHFAQDARDDRHFEQVQLVRDAVVDHGQDGRVAKNGFARAGRSRVALIGGPCVRGEQTPDVRKPLDELKRLFPRDTLALKALLRVFRARKARAAADLLRQLAENGIEVGGKMVAHGLHTHVGHAEVTGEQSYLQA